MLDTASLCTTKYTVWRSKRKCLQQPSETAEGTAGDQIGDSAPLVRSVPRVDQRGACRLADRSYRPSGPRSVLGFLGVLVRSLPAVISMDASNARCLRAPWPDGGCRQPRSTSRGRRAVPGEIPSELRRPFRSTG